MNIEELMKGLKKEEAKKKGLDIKIKGRPSPKESREKAKEFKKKSEEQGDEIKKKQRKLDINSGKLQFALNKKKLKKSLG